MPIPKTWIVFSDDKKPGQLFAAEDDYAGVRSKLSNKGFKIWGAPVFKEARDAIDYIQQILERDKVDY